MCHTNLKILQATGIALVYGKYRSKMSKGTLSAQPRRSKMARVIIKKLPAVLRKRVLYTCNTHTLPASPKAARKTRKTIIGRLNTRRSDDNFSKMAVTLSSGPVSAICSSRASAADTDRESKPGMVNGPREEAAAMLLSPRRRCDDPGDVNRPYVSLLCPQHVTKTQTHSVTYSNDLSC